MARVCVCVSRCVSVCEWQESRLRLTPWKGHSGRKGRHLGCPGRAKYSKRAGEHAELAPGLIGQAADTHRPGLVQAAPGANIHLCLQVRQSSSCEWEHVRARVRPRTCTPQEQTPPHPEPIVCGEAAHCPHTTPPLKPLRPRGRRQDNARSADRRCRAAIR